MTARRARPRAARRSAESATGSGSSCVAATPTRSHPPHLDLILELRLGMRGVAILKAMKPMPTRRGRAQEDAPGPAARARPHIAGFAHGTTALARAPAATARLDRGAARGARRAARDVAKLRNWSAAQQPVQARRRAPARSRPGGSRGAARGAAPPDGRGDRETSRARAALTALYRLDEQAAPRELLAAAARRPGRDAAGGRCADARCAAPSARSLSSSPASHARCAPRAGGTCAR